MLAGSDAAAAMGDLYDDGLQLSRLIGGPTTSLGQSIPYALGA